jgi:hypothetical protein
MLIPVLRPRCRVQVDDHPKLVLPGNAEMDAQQVIVKSWKHISDECFLPERII